MADVTLDKQPLVQEITPTAITIALNPNRLYVIGHLGKDSNGDAATEEVYIQTDGETLTADYSDSAGKIVLQNGSAKPIPPDTQLIELATASGGGNVSVEIYASEEQKGGVS